MRSFRRGWVTITRARPEGLLCAHGFTCSKDVAAEERPPTSEQVRASIYLLGTCKHVHGMAMVQIRNLPDPVHRELKVRAAREGLSLSDLLVRELTKVAERPTAADLMARIAARPRPPRPLDSARAVRAEREGRR